jgi:hypothetical protein
VVCLGAVLRRKRFEELTKGLKELLVGTQPGFVQSSYSLPAAWLHPEVHLRSPPWACQHHSPNQCRCPLALTVVLSQRGRLKHRESPKLQRGKYPPYPSSRLAIYWQRRAQFVAVVVDLHTRAYRATPVGQPLAPQGTRQHITSMPSRMVCIVTPCSNKT